MVFFSPLDVRLYTHFQTVYLLCLSNCHSQACIWPPLERSATFCFSVKDYVPLESSTKLYSLVVHLVSECGRYELKCSVIGTDYHLKLLLLHKLSLTVQKLLLNPQNIKDKLKKEVEGGRGKVRGNKKGKNTRKKDIVGDILY